MSDEIGVSRIVQKKSLSRSNKMSQIKEKRRKRTKKLLGFFLFIFLLMIVSVGSYAYLKFDGALDKIVRQGTSPKASAMSHSVDHGDTPSESKPFSLAIIGTDNRPGSGGTLNTDVMLVAFVNPEKHSVHLLSIPRDTKVKIPGYSGYRKANSTYVLGEMAKHKQEKNDEEITITGPSLVKEMLSGFLQVPIDYYVTIDFNGFKEVVDAVGGLEVDVEKSMEYDSYIDDTHIHLKKGLQTLDGENTLDYIRHRLDNRGANYQSSDFERNERQQKVIKLLLAKIASAKGIKSIPDIIDSIADHSATDIPKDMMKELILNFKLYSSDAVHTIPNEAYWDSKENFSIIPEERLAAIQAEVERILK